VNILFAGTPEFSVPSLKSIHEDSDHRVVAVLTNPDAPRGRGRKSAASAVKRYAESQGIPVVQPPRLGSEARARISEFKADLMAVVAYGRIFGPKFLALFPRGSVNLHPSLLPRHRGPAPIPAAILAGDETSGITIQEVGLEMDVGDIIIQEEFELDPLSSAADIGDYCSRRGAELLVRALDEIDSGTAVPRAQDHSRASYCSLLKKEDGRIDWSRPVDEIHRLIRAYQPWPQAHSSWEGVNVNIQSCAPVDIESLGAELAEAARRADSGRVFGVDKSSGILVKTGDGVLALTGLQLQAKRAMDWKSFINGNPRIISSRLGGLTEQ
jgi:methionyl-tRNA formyltransferase